MYNCIIIKNIFFKINNKFVFYDQPIHKIFIYFNQTQFK